MRKTIELLIRIKKQLAIAAPIVVLTITALSSFIGRRLRPALSFVKTHGLVFLLFLISLVDFRRSSRGFNFSFYARTGGALAIGLVVAVFFFSLSLTGADVIEVSVNGQTVGYVNNEAEYEALVAETKQKLVRENANADILIEDEELITASKFVPGTGTIDEEYLANEEKLAEALVQENAVKANVYVIEADGAELVALVSEEDANAVLDSFRNDFGGEGLTGDFREKIEVKSTISSLSQVKEVVTIEEAREYLLTGSSAEGLANAPFIHYEAEGVETVVESISLPGEQEETEDLVKGQEIIAVKGVVGETEITRNVKKVNGEVITYEAISEKVITKPVAEVVRIGIGATPAYGGGGTGRLGAPLNSWTLSRTVGNGHTGADMLAPHGTPIFAADGGTVIAVEYGYGGYGNILKIDHGNGLETWYAHCDTMSVSVGQQVSKGQTVATVGITGRATAYHLHFEVRVNGAVQEPMSYLN